MLLTSERNYKELSIVNNPQEFQKKSESIKV